MKLLRNIRISRRLWILIALAFVGASSKDNLKRIDELRQSHGANWPRHWLEERGVDDATRILTHS